MINNAPTIWATPSYGKPDFNVAFVSNDMQYDSIYSVEYTGEIYFLNYYRDSIETNVYHCDVSSLPPTRTWTDQAYRTITLDSPATGDFLTWLEANAVKQ